LHSGEIKTCTPIKISRSVFFFMMAVLSYCHIVQMTLDGVLDWIY
jgi:hypothetical protein